MRWLQYLKDLRLRGLSQGTIAARRRALTRLSAHLACPLERATAAQLAAWRESISGLSPVTIRSYVSHVNQFYEWAAAERLIRVNPAAGLPVPLRPRRLPRPISDEDLFEAIARAPQRIRIWLVLAGWAGLRAKEIAFLRRECVLERGPAPGILVSAEATKGRRERFVPMSGFVYRELVPLLPARGWVFRRLDCQPGPNQPWTVSRDCNLYLHALGMAETLHQLRHRFGTAAYAASRDLRAVQELMGHARPEETAGYAALQPGAAAAIVEDLPCPR